MEDSDDELFAQALDSFEQAAGPRRAAAEPLRVSNGAPGAAAAAPRACPPPPPAPQQAAPACATTAQQQGVPASVRHLFASCQPPSRPQLHAQNVWRQPGAGGPSSTAVGTGRPPAVAAPQQRQQQQPSWRQHPPRLAHAPPQQHQPAWQVHQQQQQQPAPQQLPCSSAELEAGVDAVRRADAAAADPHTALGRSGATTGTAAPLDEYPAPQPEPAGAGQPDAVPSCAVPGAPAAGEAAGSERDQRLQGPPEGSAAAVVPAPAAATPAPAATEAAAAGEAAAEAADAGAAAGAAPRRSRLRQLFDFLLVMDLEATCDRDKAAQPMPQVQLCHLRGQGARGATPAWHAVQRTRQQVALGRCRR